MPEEGAEDGAIAGLSWVDWPRGLSSRARQVVDQEEARRPANALTVLDEMIDDLGARRRAVAELTTPRTEPCRPG